jgi:hypothetical protein
METTMVLQVLDRIQPEEDEGGGGEEENMLTL